MPYSYGTLLHEVFHRASCDGLCPSKPFVMGFYTSRARGITTKVKGDDGQEVDVVEPDDVDFIKRVRYFPLQDGQAEKHYMMTDGRSGQKLNHLQMIQIELPRYKVSRLPAEGESSTNQDWWFRVLRYSDRYTEGEMEKLTAIPDFVKKALGHLDYRKWSPRLFQEYKESLADRSNYSTVLQVERAPNRPASSVA